MKNDFLSQFRNISRDFILFILPVAVIFLAIPYAIRLFLPFAAGGVIFILAKPLNKIFLKRLPKGISAFLSLFLTGLAFFLIIRLVLSTLLSELYSFSDNFSSLFSIAEKTTSDIYVKITGLSRKVPASIRYIPDFRSISSDITNAVISKLTELVSKITALLVSVAKNIPSLLIGTFTAVLTAFFLLKDGNLISDFFRRLLGDKAFFSLRNYKASIGTTLIQYLKAQLIIEGIIAAVLFSGLIILKVKYAFLLAFIIAIVDAVPILGTGTILLPWAAILLLSGNASLGWGLIALYGVCIITRQLCEPEIVGKRLGIHPLATIVSLYISIKLFGFWGILIGPFSALFLKSRLSLYPYDEKSNF